MTDIGSRTVRMYQQFHHGAGYEIGADAIEERRMSAANLNKH